MNGFVKKLPGNATVEQKLLFLQEMLEQSNQRILNLEKENIRLRQLIDPEIKTRRLFDLIREVNGHTSAMPDMSGYNGDHDRRYHLKGFPVPTTGIYWTDEKGRKLWYAGVDNGDWVLQFDVNLGVGTPDFASGEVLRYHPNFG